MKTRIVVLAVLAMVVTVSATQADNFVGYRPPRAVYHDNVGQTIGGLDRYVRGSFNSAHRIVVGGGLNPYRTYHPRYDNNFMDGMRRAHLSSRVTVPVLGAAAVGFIVHEIDKRHHCRRKCDDERSDDSEEGQQEQEVAPAAKPEPEIVHLEVVPPPQAPTVIPSSGDQQARRMAELMGIFLVVFVCLIGCMGLVILLGWSRRPQPQQAPGGCCGHHYGHQPPTTPPGSTS